ncbi:SprT-like domain-containing protein [Mycoplasmoides alvi]|uniref:SprT-like domain-containing protein n=1 Tax=Mycoplasmoides alvi TaxID=78580 RepID=UPI00051C003D|nr:SprT-like domain-containing protein [Mycoplasmoides alvi]
MEIKKINVLENFYCCMSRCIDYLNEYVFDGLFNEIVFVIQGERSTSVNSLGVFWANKWKINDKKSHELSITSEAITWQDPKKILNTLTHELIHYKAFVMDIKDTNKSGKFHNKEFKKLGEEIGAIFDLKDPKIGYSDFKASPELDKIFENCINESGLNKILGEYTRIKKPSEKSIKKFFKYMCPGCNISIKAPLDAQIICASDGIEYEFRDKLPINDLDD